MSCLFLCGEQLWLLRFLCFLIPILKLIIWFLQKSCWYFYWGYSELIDEFGGNFHLNNIKFYNSLQLYLSIWKSDLVILLNALYLIYYTYIFLFYYIALKDLLIDLMLLKWYSLGCSHKCLGQLKLVVTNLSDRHYGYMKQCWRLLVYMMTITDKTWTIAH